MPKFFKHFDFSVVLYNCTETTVTIMLCDSRVNLHKRADILSFVAGYY